MRTLLAALALCCVSAEAAAHVGHQHDVAAEETLQTRADWRFGEFNFNDAARGHWSTLALGATWSPQPWFAADATVPWSYLRMADGRGAIGLGDIGASARFQFGPPVVRGYAGLAVGAPTGDHTVGIGGGHFELAPIAGARLTLGRWELSTQLSHQEALGEDRDDHVPHGALLAPHWRRETTAAIGVDYVRDLWSVRWRGDGVVSYGAPMGGTSTALGVALRPAERWSFGADAELPVTGFHRFRWRAGVNITLHVN